MDTAQRWYSEMDAEYFRATNLHLHQVSGENCPSDEVIERWYNLHLQMREARKPSSNKPALYQDMLVRHRDGWIYRVISWSGIPSLNGVAVLGITSDLQATKVLEEIPPDITLFCCSNRVGPPQFTYIFTSKDVKPIEDAE